MHNVGKLQWRCTGKQDFTRGAEFDDRAFLRAQSTQPISLSRISSTSELNRNANWRSFWKKAGKIGDCAVLQRPRWSYGWLHQAIVTLSLTDFLRPPLARFEGTVPIRFEGAVGAPLFPVRKSLGSQNPRLCRREKHDRDHSAERKD